MRLWNAALLTACLAGFAGCDDDGDASGEARDSGVSGGAMADAEIDPMGGAGGAPMGGEGGMGGGPMGGVPMGGVGGEPMGGVPMGGEGGAGGEPECVPSGPEMCDGIDNDCDGLIDNMRVAASPCAVGEGACAAEGIMACEMGEWVCDAEAGEPAEEICNEIDDNCDGQIDEGVCPRRSTILLCGNYQRDLMALFSPEDGVEVLDGCAPDGDTRAMAISRSGVGQVDIPAVGAWLDAGGVLMTEYNISDEVFNAAFPGANVVQPEQRSGSCKDNLNPVVRFNEADPFWQVNGELPLQEPEWSGCGFDMSAYPGITPLGGWDEDTVSLAYRDRGEGRVWLVEADWQDSDGDGAFNAASQQIMRSILLGSDAPPVLEEEPPIMGMMRPGVQLDVPVDEVLSAGFNICYEDVYGDDLNEMELVLNCAAEPESVVMVGCMPVESDTLTVAAEGLASEVFLPVPGEVAASHVHNEVQWYFTEGFSFGFAPEGAPITRSQCDTNNEQGESKLCWHTIPNVGGYRCGATAGLNQSQEWLRVVYTRRGEAGEEGPIEEEIIEEGAGPEEGGGEGEGAEPERRPIEPPGR